MDVLDGNGPAQVQPETTTITPPTPEMYAHSRACMGRLNNMDVLDGTGPARVQPEITTITPPTPALHAHSRACIGRLSNMGVLDGNGPAQVRPEITIITLPTPGIHTCMHAQMRMNACMHAHTSMHACMQSLQPSGSIPRTEGQALTLPHDWSTFSALLHHCVWSVSDHAPQHS